MNKKVNKKPAKLLTPFKVGIYQLGYQWVELWINPQNGDGNFQWMPGECRDPQKAKDRHRITVGVNGPLWAAWGVLLHEAFESTLCDNACRFRPTGHYVQASSDCYHFTFNHLQFTEVAARVGSFLCEVRKDFEAAWRKCQKRK